VTRRPVLAPGYVLRDRYVVEELMGEGAMASVWRARDRHLDRPVAVKVPRDEWSSSPAFVERFSREVRRLVGLEHPHIVRLYDLLEQDGRTIAVLAYLDGGNLRDRIARAGAGRPLRLPAGDLAAWLPTVASALDFIHARGVVHRDVKPENILFDAAGHAHVADFGIAKAKGVEESLTPSNRFVGTPGYLAPEALRTLDLTPQADQYALATSAFETVAGAAPFPPGALPASVARRIAEDAPRASQVAPDASIPAALDAALARALARDPSARFPSCAAFAAAACGSDASG